MEDRPGRQQQDRRLALPVDLVEDLDAVALDIAVGVGVARTALLRSGSGECRGRGGCAHRVSSSFDCSHASIQASSSSWPSETPERRSSSIPWLKVITKLTRASNGNSCGSSP